MKDRDITAAKAIAEAVAQKGGKVYYVGGFVRDSIMGNESKDIDIEVHGINPDELLSVLKGIGTPILMGADFGVYGLTHLDIYISMPRKEDDQRGGKDDFASHIDPFIGTEKSAKRRDFTMNALMQDVLTGEIIDHFGGIQDIKNGVIRHVSDDTFVQDPLRVLRAARFASRFGFDIAPETMELCRNIKLDGLAFERVYEELKKALMKSERPSLFFEELRRMDALDVWFPEVKALIGVKQPPQHHPEGDVWNHTMLVLDNGALLRDKAENKCGFMLSALCHDLGKPATTTDEDGHIHSIGHEFVGVDITKKFIGRLTQDASLQKYVLNMVELHMRPNILESQKSSAKAFCKVFDLSVCPKDLLLLSEADYCGRNGHKDYTRKRECLHEMLSLFEERMAKDHVKGADLIKAGFKPGKEFGKALEFAHKLRVSGVEKKEALRQTIAYLRSLL